MAKFSDSALLKTKTRGMIYIDLFSGYGQPSTTQIVMKNIQGQEELLMSFDGNVTHHELGSARKLKYNKLEIRTTIHDVHDNPIEKIDMSLSIKVFDLDASEVETNFSMKTIGMGTILYSDFHITIM
ncbi:hypothetical protein SAMN00777080_4765 [Aquiflexum balticum DSM 16537]|uniref:Uncharacterized protein n=1 Tax=Aquiflexum balticum DSM 16537 TaxID=758820 RepID=A0A1W2HBY3_9BACT|nr:hypothetical protein [Aquiflexum balticum]SMD46086.1 hypothetical protein SAMN00777080_4765 [Aquiflexum balticum DSM 16537]